jgi:hypothetical protein
LNFRFRTQISSFENHVKIFETTRGRVAQLGERIVRNDEVAGSTPVSSTKSIAQNIGTLMEARMHRRRTPVHAIISVTFACSALLGIALVGLSASRASDNPADKAWTAYAQAQRQWQQELADFLSTQRRDLKEVIAASRDLQLALIDRRSFEFHYLLATHPERIVTNQGISQFANFPWTDQDTIALSRSNPDYAATVKRVELLRQRSDSNPLWSALREANRSLANQPEYQKIYARFEQGLKTAEKILQDTR